MAIAQNSSVILDEMRMLGEVQGNTSASKLLNSELWHACAGPLVSLPQPNTLVYYFPQGHTEQVTASTRKILNSHIPNYPTLPSQLLCQVHNVTLHADRDTDEIYAQMTLQPVNYESDVFPIQKSGQSVSKQPNEFFCKNLTASDTSTHGGFSVPRRAAEKLFPQLDYSMQPPNQELIVRDLHDNAWTFRHIYRGQPRRHLLTTGWSLFVSTKRLKAGDSVLFIRDENSQLLLGVRRANHQQTALPSSVLSTDSMHIGVLAAAAHAAASRSPFTVYYNPRACPSDFIIPLAKYHKAVYTQVSIGMRFGMMFETEESTKRRYMGTIVGVSDFDTLRWPNSKWRNLQVEWDEHGYGERPDRVSLWEIETPESLFVFPMASLKRQCLPGFIVPGAETVFGNVNALSQAPECGTGNMLPIIPSIGSNQLLKMLLTPQTPSPDTQLISKQSIYASILQKIEGHGIARPLSSSPTFSAARNLLQHEAMACKPTTHQNQLSLVPQQVPPSQSLLLEAQKSRYSVEQQVVDQDSKPEAQVEKPDEHFIAPSEKTCHQQCKNTQVAQKTDIPPGGVVTDQVELSEKGKRGDVDSPCNHENAVCPTIIDQEQMLKEQGNPQLHKLEPAAAQVPVLASAHLLDKDNPIHSNIQVIDNDVWMLQDSSYQSCTGPSQEPGFFSSTAIPDPLFLLRSDGVVSPSADISLVVNPETLSPLEAFPLPCFSDPRTPQCLPSYLQEFFSGPEENPVHEEVLGSDVLSSDAHNIEARQQENDLQKISNSCVMRDLSDGSINQSDTYSNLLFEASNGNMITGSCVSSTVLEGFSSARDSSFCVPSDDIFSSFTCNGELQSQVTTANFPLQEIPERSGGTMKQVAHQPLRTYTKVQKLGSVGRSIDVTRFKDYHELQSAIACMFGLEGQLDDPRGSEWKLVYVDYENDVLLVGDDPWEEFVKCVRCIRILSPSEVQQMSEEGIRLMSSYHPSCS